MSPTSASAVGTILFQNSFADRAVDGTGTVTVPTPTSGTNVACLTAAGNSSTLPLLSCAAAPDSQGSGKLRLTSATGNQIGGVFGATSFPTSNGLDVTFNTYQWGGGMADGMSFVLAAVDPANPAAPTAIGPGGGSLGYSPAGSVKGLPNAYLGVGLDTFGNFSNPAFQGTGCAANANIAAATPGAVVVRGPGNNAAGYCGLTTTWDGTTGSKVTLHATTRAASVVPVEVLINPTAAPFTSTTGVVVSAGTYKVVFTPISQPTKTLSGSLPTVAAGVYPSTTWLNSSGVPRQLAFGFVGSTGSVTDNHEASDVKVLTFNPVPQLSVVSTSYTAAAPAVGAPVTYSIATGVLVGADETSPISMTQTTPTGVVPVGAYGTGWTCATPVGQAITCTTTASTFSNGTALPAITVVGIVTSSSMTATTVQNASSAGVSSIDANPSTDSVTTAGTLPTGPGGVTAVPALGAIAGGGLVTLSGSNILLATAIEIGTTAEQAAGAPVVLLPCPGGIAAAGCFTVSGSTLRISSMPSRSAAASVGITVVTAGLASAASYVYASAPATIAAPTAVAGITSATATWLAPAANGSAITSYSVTPYLAGVAGTAILTDGSTLSHAFAGLTAGGSYTFSVTATNAYGTSAASPKSPAVIPYTVPGAPTITAATAGTSSATLSWSTPSNGSSATTGYVVTPYLGVVAQAAQSFPATATTQSITGLTSGSAYTFTVVAQNAAGNGPASARSASVTPNVSPSLSFSAPPAGEVGAAYSRQLTVTNGTSPFTWSISAGALPDGLTIGATTGILSGVPTVAGSFTFTVQITDASGQVASKSATIAVATAPTVSFSPGSGEVGVSFGQSPAVVGGTGPFSWTITSGSLPAGVTINATSGLISGTPTGAGSFSVTVAVADSFGQSASKAASFTILAQPSLTFAAPPTGKVGVAYSDSFDVTGGSLPLTWSISSGALPAGLLLSSASGVVSGTPIAAGTSSFTVSVVDANGQSASRAVSISIGVGPIVIVKSANTASATSGSIVAYTITVTNTDTAPVTNVALTDSLNAVLDDASYNSNATATSGTVNYASSSVGWTGTVAAGATVTITYSVTVNSPDTGNKILADTVAASNVGTNCGTGSIDARCASTVTVPGLSIVASSDVSTTVPGGIVHFTILVTNTGQTAYPLANLSESLASVLDDATYNSDGTATIGSVGYSASVLSWSGALAPGAAATITYSVTVANPDTGNRTLAGSVASSSSGSPCPVGAPIAACIVSVTVLVPALRISSSADAANATPGTIVHYSVIIANTGQTAYPAGTQVTLDMGGALDDATYDGDAAVTGGGAITVSAGTVTWTGSLAIGATVTVSASVTVRSPDPGDKVMSTTTTSSAAGSLCAPGGSAPACSTSTSVLIPGLTISNTADSGSTTPGAVVHYTVSATNTGQTEYPGAVFTEDLGAILDDATYSGGASATAGAVSVSGSTLSWTGNLAVGASATITFSVTVRDPDHGDLVLNSTVVSSTVGATCAAGSTDGRCSASVAVLVPALSFASSLDSTTTTPGSIVTYSATFTNTGQTSYSGLSVSLGLAGALDDAAYDHDGAATSGGLVVGSDGSLTWTMSLAPGATATATLTLTVTDPDAGDRALSIRASSSAAGSACPVASTNAACVATTTVLIPGLTITKTSNVSSVSPGGTVGYTIAITNSGQTAYSGATVTDSLGAVLTDATFDPATAVASSGTVAYSSGVLTWVGSLVPGTTAIVTYSVVIRDPDPGDKQLVNTVVSSAAGNNCVAGGADPRCTSAVSVLVPSLDIAKTANVATTAAGSSVVYTIKVTNSGPTTYSSANLTDPLAGVLDDASYSGDVAANVGTVSSTGSTISWHGALAPLGTATITYSVLVHTGPGGDNLLTGAVTSTSSGSNCVAGGTDVRCGPVVPVARLVISQHYSAATTTPGATLTLTGTFTNTGQVPYTGIAVASPSADTVDDAIPTGDQTATSGTLVLSSTAITWTGNIPVGGVVTVTGTLLVTDPDLGNKIVTGTLQSAAPGSNCPSGGSDPRCTATSIVLVPALTITTTASSSVAVPGGTVGYTVSIHNTGQTDYSAANVSSTLAGMLDDASYNSDASATSGTVSYTSPVLAWTGSIAAGTTVVITYSATVATAGTGDKTMIIPTSSTTVGNTCPAASSNAACRTTVLVLTPALTMRATVDHHTATLGSIVNYTVTITNSGQTGYSAAALTDTLSGIVDDATYVPGSLAAASGTASISGNVISWTGALAVGATATVTYSVTINVPDSGDGSLSDQLLSSTPGNNCVAGNADPRCFAVVAVTQSVSLTFTKTSDVAVTTAGAVVHYTVSATNSSDADLAANFADPLAGILDDAAYNHDAAATGGTVTFVSPTLDWTGTIPAGSSIAVTYSVNVNLAVTGDQILAGTLTSTAFPASDNCIAGSTDPRCASSIPIARLLIQQHYAESGTTPGSIVHLTATFTNTGKYPYTGIAVAAPSAGSVDDAIPGGDQTASSGTLVLSATAITWTGSIPVGATITVAGTLTVENPDPGDKVISGTLVSSAPGSNCPSAGSDPLCTASVPVLVPGLTIVKSVNTTFVVPGGTASYTITVHNTGQTPYANAVVTDSLAGVLDDAAFNSGSSATAGGLVLTGQNLVWTGSLAVGAIATISYSVTAYSPDTGDKTMISPVSSTEVGSTCPPASGSAACRSTVAVLTPLLTIVSSVDHVTAVPGGTVNYTITATNAGQFPYGSASLSVNLAGLADDTSSVGGVTTTSGTAGIASGVLSWQGALGLGATTTITYSAVVSASVTGDFLLRQTVVSGTQGSNCPASGVDPRCATSVPIATLHIVNSADTTSTLPNGVIHYTGTFTNTGLVPYVGISVTDSFVGALDDATYNGDAAATAGSLLLDTGSGSVVWTGDVPVGASVVITGSVTVNSPATGDGAVTTHITTAAVASNCPAGGTDPSCSTSAVVLIPALTITTSASTVSAAPGSFVDYTTTISNTGQTDYTAAVVDTELAGALDDGSYDGAGTATTGTLTLAGSELGWTGDLPVGRSAVISYRILVDDPDLGDRSMLEEVSSDELGSTCESGVANALCASTVSVLVPALDVAVSADATTAVPGAAVGYTVTLHNTGQTTYTDAAVTVDLAAAVDDAAGPTSVAASGGESSTTASTLHWIGDLAIGQTIVISYVMTVSNPDVGNHLLSTSVTSSATGSTCGAAAQCSNAVTVLIPGLAISTSASSVTATPGDRVVFTIQLSNTGQTPYTSAEVHTSLAGLLDDSDIDGPASATVGVAGYASGVVSWSGVLPVGATATVTYAVVVAEPDAGDRTLSSTVVSSSVGSNCGPASTDVDCSVSVGVLIPQLTIGMSAGSATTTPGGTVGFTVVIANTGQTAYPAAVVAVSLAGDFPDAIYNADAVVIGGGAVEYAAPVLTWTGALPVGASATITYSVSVHDPDTGDKSMITRVSSAAAGSSCPADGSGVACSALVRVLVPALLIEQSVDTTSVVAGSQVHYTVTLTNTGQTDYAAANFSEALGAVLDDATYDGDATASAGTAVFTNATGTLSWSGPIPTLGTVTVTFSVTTTFPALGDHTLLGGVGSSSPGATCRIGTEPGCGTSVAVLIPELSITKTADTTAVVAGATIQYTIVAANLGQADYANAALADSLAEVLDDGVYNGDATSNLGNVSYTGDVLHWSGRLVRGATVTIGYSVTTNASDPGDGILTNSVESSTVGSTCLPGSTAANCLVLVPIAARSITLSSLTPGFTLTGLPQSTVTSDNAVTMVVTTNSTGGYTVAVEAESDSLVGANPSNSATIPTSDLLVRRSGTQDFFPLSLTSRLMLDQDHASAAGGDILSNDFRMTIPFVPGDTYSGTIDYIATAQ